MTSRLALAAVVAMLTGSCSLVEIKRYQSRVPEQPVVELMGLSAIPSGTGADDPPVEKKFRNIQVLQGLPSSQIYPVMSMFANSLGVTCAHCHTEFFEEETRPEKQIARQMIRLTRAINRAQFQGEATVTCYTCHNGKQYPPTVAPIADAGWQAVLRPRPESPELPEIDAVLARYEAARGGKGAKAVVGGSGTVKIVGGLDEQTSGTFELAAKENGAPDIRSSIAVPPPGRAAIARYARGDLDLGSMYGDLSVFHRDVLDGKNVVIVAAHSADAELPDFLSFDMSSGELVRIQTGTSTAMGFVPEEVLFRDYRVIGGTAVPQSVWWARGDFAVILEFSDPGAAR